MKKSFFILSIAALLVVFVCIYYVKVNEQGQQEGKTLIKAFETSGAALVSSEVYFWGVMEDRFLDMKVTYGLVEDIMSRINVVKDDKFTQQEVEDGQVRKSEIGGVTADGRIMKLTIHMSKGASAEAERTISLSVTQKLSSDRLEDTRKSIINVFEKYGIEARINACLTGTYDGELEYQQLNDIAQQVLGKADARKIEGVRDQNYVSVSAYSPYIGQYIKVHGKKVNLNLASRYNAYENKTYIWLATPVITTEY